MNGMFSNNTNTTAAPAPVPQRPAINSRYMESPTAMALQSVLPRVQQNNPASFSNILSRMYDVRARAMNGGAPMQPAMQAPQPMQTPQTSPLSSVPYMAFLQNPQFIQYASRNPQLSQLLAVLARKQPSLFNQRIS